MLGYARKGRGGRGCLSPGRAEGFLLWGEGMPFLAPGRTGREKGVRGAGDACLAPGRAGRA